MSLQEYQQSRRYTWLVDGEIAGYAHQVSNLTFVQVTNLFSIC
jgi:hypothetical protein